MNRTNQDLPSWPRIYVSLSLDVFRCSHQRWKQKPEKEMLAVILHRAKPWDAKCWQEKVINRSLSNQDNQYACSQEASLEQLVMASFKSKQRVMMLIPCSFLLSASTLFHLKLIFYPWGKGQRLAKLFLDCEGGMAGFIMLILQVWSQRFKEIQSKILLSHFDSVG